MHGATTRVKTLAELQKKFGWDLHGEVKKCEPKDNDLTPESMGGSSVTFRLPWGPRSPPGSADAFRREDRRPLARRARVRRRTLPRVLLAGGRRRLQRASFQRQFSRHDLRPALAARQFQWLRLGREPWRVLVRGRRGQVRRSQGKDREGAQPRRVQFRQSLAGDGRRQARGHARRRGLLVDALDGRLSGREDHGILQDVRQGHRGHGRGHAGGLRAVHQRHGPADDPRVHRRQRRRRHAAPSRAHQGHVRLGRK